MKKHILTLMAAAFVAACSSGDDGKSADDWEKTASPLVVTDASPEARNSIDAISLNAGLENGKQLFLLGGNRAISFWTGSNWVNVTPPASLVGAVEDLLSFVVRPDGKTAWAATTSDRILFFDGAGWSDLNLASCMDTANTDVIDTSFDVKSNAIALLNDAGTICEYRLDQKKWRSMNVAVGTADPSELTLSMIAEDGSFYLLNTDGGMIQFDAAGVGRDISAGLDFSHHIVPGGDGFSVGGQANEVVVFDDVANDFYRRVDGKWLASGLNLARFNATDVVERRYGFGSNKELYIVAALNNNKVAAYRDGTWREVPVSIASDEDISMVFGTMNGKDPKVLIGATRGEVAEYFLHDLVNGSTANLSADRPDVTRIVASADLGTVFGMTESAQIFQFEPKDGRWSATGFDIGSFGANGIMSAVVTNDGVLSMGLSNGEVVVFD
ncbi:hypothetical protein [Cupriavidus agavae]|uniref:Uncharacterized protein n=1 Tax=Cupriavidus agavae TaxID=1001822 RepID=A0A4Q7S5W8_9BURK|nr:hypothetical protein [Cupriavidus agavae]RZT41761.1 hypothetical protein EV147_0765 [Cupriavidus agavae]